MKVFWSRCGHGHGNFGDKLTPLLLDYLNLSYEWASPEEAELIGIGSLLEKVPQDFAGAIWTTGCMQAETVRTFPKAQILALRGALTADRVRPKAATTVLGDGGLLCDLFYEDRGKKFRLGVIPHFADQNEASLRKLQESEKEILFIDVCAPTLEVIQQVGSCEAILSSSLHGLILADSLDVPNAWIELNPTSVTGSGFKFRDYFSNFGLEQMEAFPLSGNEKLPTLLQLTAMYRRPGLAEVRQRLHQSLGRLEERFAGTGHKRRSSSEIRAREERSSVERANWMKELRRIHGLVGANVPVRSSTIIIDAEELRSELQNIRPTMRPFLEIEGNYGGLPDSDEHATQQLNRKITEGVEYLLIAEGSFWWMEAYPEFSHLLERAYSLVISDSRLRIYRRR